jgi:hypothetical protein
MRHDKSLNRVEGGTAQSFRRGESHGFQPELALPVRGPDMDVRGLIFHVGIEVESKWTDAQNSWHPAMLEVEGASRSSASP